MRMSLVKYRNPLEAFLKPLILKDYRTIQDFAARLPFQRGTLFGIMKGTCGLTNRYILCIAEALRIPGEDLLPFHSGKHEKPSLIPYEKPDRRSRPEKPETKIKNTIVQIIKSAPVERVAASAKIKRNQKTEAMQGSPEYAVNMARAAAERRMLERMRNPVIDPLTGRHAPLPIKDAPPQGLFEDGRCKFPLRTRWCNEMRQVNTPYCSEHLAICYNAGRAALLRNIKIMKNP